MANAEEGPLRNDNTSRLSERRSCEEECVLTPAGIRKGRDGGECHCVQGGAMARACDFKRARREGGLGWQVGCSCKRPRNTL